MTEENLQRFTGIRALYGEEGFARLQQAHVLVAGVGGVGSWAAEALCRSAVGRLTLVDPDVIDIKNTNRQLHTTSRTVGKSKAQVLAARLREINPEITVTVKETWLTPENLASVLDPLPLFAADAIDDIKAKCALINYLHQNKVFLVTSGGAGARVHPELLQYGDLSAAHGDGLIKHVRDILRREYNFPPEGQRMGVLCTDSPEKPVYTSKQDADLPHFGAAMPVTATAGLLIASLLISAIAAGNSRA